MKENEFKKLKVGDEVTHPRVGGILTIDWIEETWNYAPETPEKFTSAITAIGSNCFRLTNYFDVGVLEIAASK